ncbi:MAG: tRNA (adenosine(37)-N6)-threonylcarbamoyltransferase complex dimerization subunit type 1 TsaB [bacterium]
MIIVGIETSTRLGSAALVSENEIVAEYIINTKSHSEQVLREIDQILLSAGKSLEECEAVAVSIGPGSFTGLRIGVSTAKALAFAMNRPILGISTLEALAWNLPFPCGLVCPMIDARKSEVYTALYQWSKGKLRVLIPEMAVSPETMIHRLDRSCKTIFVGNGSHLYEEMIRAEFGEKAEFSPWHHNFPRASVVAGLGLHRLALHQVDRIETLVPTYLRPSDAEVNWAKKP